MGYIIMLCWGGGRMHTKEEGGAGAGAGAGAGTGGWGGVGVDIYLVGRGSV
jgi:hypothetical protein